MELHWASYGPASQGWSLSQQEIVLVPDWLPTYSWEVSLSTPWCTQTLISYPLYLQPLQLPPCNIIKHGMMSCGGSCIFNRYRLQTALTLLLVVSGLQFSVAKLFCWQWLHVLNACQWSVGDCIRFIRYESVSYGYGG